MVSSAALKAELPDSSLCLSSLGSLEGEAEFPGLNETSKLPPHTVTHQSGSRATPQERYLVKEPRSQSTQVWFWPAPRSSCVSSSHSLSGSTTSPTRRRGQGRQALWRARLQHCAVGTPGPQLPIAGACCLFATHHTTVTREALTVWP